MSGGLQRREVQSIVLFRRVIVMHNVALHFLLLPLYIPVHQCLLHFPSIFIYGTYGVHAGIHEIHEPDTTI